MKKRVLKRVVSILAILTLFFTFFITPKAIAEEVQSGPMIGFMMTPMTESLVLKPGDTYKGSFYIVNPEQNTIPIDYTLKVQSFYRDDDGNAIFEDVEGRSEITKWIVLDVPDTGTLAPNESIHVFYTINVPFDVPEGGQYAAITATSLTSGESQPNSATLKESVAMAHTIFTEIEGHTIRDADITNLHIPNFISDGNITASSITTNTGNIHGTATYTMEIYPIFSSNPVYSNKDDPEKKLILPYRTFTHEISWDKTPMIGLFNVHYRVDFEGGEFKELTKLVIKCPIWVIIIAIAVIIIAIVFIIIKIKSQKNTVENV